jgi:nitronate monooxygenase
LAGEEIVTNIQQLTDQLSLPVLAAPLFTISNPDLVIAQCLNGIVGSFPALNARPKKDLDRWLTSKAPIIITSLRAPEDLVRRVHGYRGLVFRDVTTVRHAEKALEAGVDRLILVCAGAGGHAGLLNPFALLGEVRRFYDGPSCSPEPSPPERPSSPRRPWEPTSRTWAPGSSPRRNRRPQKHTSP